VMTEVQAERVLNIREENRPQRDICTAYYFLTYNAKTKFYEKAYFVSNEVIYSSTFLTTYSKDGSLVMSDWDDGISTSALNSFLSFLKRKVSKYPTKFTLRENRENFLNKLKRIPTLKDLNADFIDNNFHFTDSIWTNKLEQHSLPAIKASEFTVLLRMYLDSMQFNGATKNDLIHWLAYEFFGVKGFTYDNLKTYLERKSLSKKHKTAGSTIVKSFQKRYKDES
jgi:hypothetical protein